MKKIAPKILAKDETFENMLFEPVMKTKKKSITNLQHFHGKRNSIGTHTSKSKAVAYF